MRCKLQLGRMNTIERDVDLLRSSELVHGHLRALELADDRCRVEVSCVGGRAEGDGADYFEALVEVRRKLEADGFLLVIAGARADVWPSAMSRGMGCGQLAYRMTLGRQALSTDLVDIFAPDESHSPATIEAQKAYREAWFKSLGREEPNAT